MCVYSVRTGEPTASRAAASSGSSARSVRPPTSGCATIITGLVLKMGVAVGAWPEHVQTARRRAIGRSMRLHGRVLDGGWANASAWRTGCNAIITLVPAVSSRSVHVRGANLVSPKLPEIRRG